MAAGRKRAIEDHSTYSATMAQVIRRHITPGLLIGLDMLIAADIISSVTLERTLESIAGLGLLVLIRTFLSWTLELETEGRWPWEPGAKTSGG